MKIICAAILISLASMQVYAADTRYLQGLGDTRYHHVESSVIGRAFHIYVMVPDEYDAASGTKYPTVYLLDGGGLYPMMTAYYQYLNFGEEIPDSIIVGISYGANDFAGGNYRSTDYTAPSDEREYWGGAADFQKFLTDELFPIIEGGYLSNPLRRIIFGQSIGGQFVLYTALTKPNLFWGHVASNPALHRNFAFFMSPHAKPDAEQERSRLFIGDGTLNDAQFREPAMEWVRHWSGVRDKPWDLRVVDLEGHSHMSAPPAAFRAGMQWLFATD